MDCSRFGLFHSLTFSLVLSTHNLVVHFCNLVLESPCTQSDFKLFRSFDLAL
jgi:hypothetical protein